MIERRAGEMTTLETRSEANEQVDREKRYAQILECLEDYSFTAKELAVLMNIKGYIPTTERNFTAPRLTELAQKGKVEPVGKKRDSWTGRMVTVYRRCYYG